MRALTVVPGQAGSAQVRDVPEPDPGEGSVLVKGLAMGVCGTDAEIVAGHYGEPPPGSDFLVLGHESLGRVLEAPAGSPVTAGDLVVGIVRRPDPVPCPACAVGEWDMCRNGQYTERGIKGRHGYASERWRVEPDFVVRIDAALGDLGILLEPTSVVAKAWEHIERIGGRSRSWSPRRVFVTGAGPIGLLAAMLGVQRGLDVHVLDRVTDGPKPDLVGDLGATYHHTTVEEACGSADVVVECTGVADVVFRVVACNAPDGVVCLTGVSSGGRSISIDGGLLNRQMVLQNDVVFGSVNANRDHYQAAADALAAADRSWLGRLITRRHPLADFEAALQRGPDDVKVVVDLVS
ncbi:MAG TPA: glucose 1-dehydrogenase [Acidimicrobiales bacterium]|nr:glucose 1-dehydrogenase [Acidimicrobiales bacterium]